MQKKSNFKGALYSFGFYLLISIILVFEALVANVVLLASYDMNLIEFMFNAGIFSIWGLLFTAGQVLLTYYSGRICAKFSSPEDTQKPIVLAFILLVPAIALSVFFIGSDTIIEIAIICSATLYSYVSGYHSSNKT